MSSPTIHLISDLFLGFNEFSTEEETIPDVDLVVINGNIGALKRGMLYASSLCKKYPSTQFVYNLGQSELYGAAPEKFQDEYKKQILLRKDIDKSWQPNLHVMFEDSAIIKCRNNIELDIFCAYGFPKIYKVYGDWNKTEWARFYYPNICDDEHNQKYRPQGTSNVCHGVIPVPTTIDWINNAHMSEWNKVKKWEVTNNNLRKILITHLNPYKDTRYANQETSAYQIHLDNSAFWLASNTMCDGIKFYGGKLYAYPGRGLDKRSKVIQPT